MDALSLLKLLWRNTPTHANDTQSSFAETDDDDVESFFDLDVTSSDFDANSCDSRIVPFNADEDNVFLKSNKSTSTPASPISILTSNPSFRGKMFGKSRAAERQKAGDRNRAKKTARLFTVRLEVKQTPSDGSPQRNNSFDPKDGFMKYFKHFGVSYVGGASRRYGYGGDDTSLATRRFSPSSSPVAPSKKGKGKGKFLGMSKSVVLSSSVADNGRGRTSASIAEQQEGIDGAILHCKKSYYLTE